MGTEDPHNHTPLLQIPIKIKQNIPHILISTLLPNETNIKKSNKTKKLTIKLLNTNQQQYKLPLLIQNTKLNQVTQPHSTNIKNHNFFGHYSINSKNPTNQLNNTTYQSTQSTKNITKKSSIHKAQTGLIQNLEHHHNILNKHMTHIKINITKEQQNNKTI